MKLMIADHYARIKSVNRELAREVTLLRSQCDGLAKERSALVLERARLERERELESSPARGRGLKQRRAKR